jgi:mono/diheme cytochrome c family protein
MPKQSLIAAVAAVAAALAAPCAFAADKATVTFFQEVCGACHGENGQGTPGLAPPLKGNKFVLESSAADIASTVSNGRVGDQKRYKDLPSPMPAQKLSDTKMKNLVDYVKGDLQK